jgi:hypothetical protein
MVEVELAPAPGAVVSGVTNVGSQAAFTRRSELSDCHAVKCGSLPGHKATSLLSSPTQENDAGLPVHRASAQFFHLSASPEGC